MTPLISIIIPAYNCEKTIENCISSLIKQTFDNIEIIIVNDGSKDKTYEICKILHKSDNRVKVINQENAGVSTARNVGIANAIGKYVMFVDSDDSVCPEICEKMVGVMESTQPDLVISGYYECSDVNTTVRLPNDTEILDESFDSIFERVVINGMINIPWNKIFVRSRIVQGFNKERCIGEDLEFNLSYLEDCKRIEILNEPLYYYNVASEGSLTKRKLLVFEAKYHSCEIIEKYIKKNNLVFSSLETRYFSAFISSMKVSFLERKGYKAFKEDFKYLRKEFYYQIAKQKKAKSFIFVIAKYSLLLNVCFLMYLLFSLKYHS